VLAIDIDARKIDDARHNAAIYGVADRIEFVAGDCLRVLAMLLVRSLLAKIVCLFM
jgi:predicted O-methyltransferase YrrM